MNSFTTEMVVGENVAIETYTQGGAPSLIVLPSFGRDGGADYDNFSARVASSGARVLRPQPRGIGQSEGSMQASLSELAGDVAMVIRQLGGGRAFVLGHAFGTVVARVLATNYPELVAGTILTADATGGATKDIEETPFIAGDLSRPEGERLEALQKAFFAPHHDAHAWLEGWYPATLQMQKSAADGADLPSFYKAGYAPVLQILGECDPFSPYKTWRSLREQFGDRITARIVTDASHALFPEQPAQVAEQVTSWLRSF